MLAITPILRLLLTFAIAWFYHALTAPFVPSGVVHIVVVVALGIPTWLLVGRYLFPVDGRSPIPGME